MQVVVSVIMHQDLPSPGSQLPLSFSLLSQSDRDYPPEHLAPLTHVPTRPRPALAVSRLLSETSVREVTMNDLPDRVPFFHAIWLFI